MDSILELISSGFSYLFGWLYNFVFNDMFDFIKNTGSSVFAYLYNKIGDIFSLDFIFLFIGFIIFFVFLNIIVNIIRG